MAERKQEAFTVTDRRLFTTEGEPRQETQEEEMVAAEPPMAAKPAAAKSEEIPAPPTSTEQQQQADAYRKSTKDMDRKVELSGQSAKDLEMTFERFLASLYMSAMLQLGLMHEEGGQPRVDLLGARQTVDTISLLAEKTKGNLTPTEQNFLQNALYELRMAYVEVTNALARPPQQATGTNPIKR
jgi:hypothetical protein